MIAKVFQGKSSGARALINYVYGQDKKPEVVHSNMCVDVDRKGFLGELKANIQERPNISRPVFHGVLSAAPGDKINNEKWGAIVKDYMDEMGFKDCAYVAVRHFDKGHPHVHIVASRVSVDRQLVKDSWEKMRSHQVAHELERKHGLHQIQRNQAMPERSVSRNEYNMQKRLGKPSARTQIRQVLDDANRDMNMSELSRKLKNDGVELVPRLTKDSSKIIGVYFEKDGVKISGSKVHKSYSWPQLQKQFEYERERDFDALVHEKEPVKEAMQTRVNALVVKPESRPVVKPLITPEFKASVKPVLPPTIKPPVQEDYKAVLRSALKQASWEKGFKTWANSLRTKHIEPVPLGTTDDPGKLRGMSFKYKDELIKGSSLGKSYSWKHIEARLGGFEKKRDLEAFRHVQVPNQGILAIEKRLLSVLDRESNQKKSNVTRQNETEKTELSVKVGGGNNESERRIDVGIKRVLSATNGPDRPAEPTKQPAHQRAHIRTQDTQSVIEQEPRRVGQAQFVIEGENAKTDGLTKPQRVGSVGDKLNIDGRHHGIDDEQLAQGSKLLDATTAKRSVDRVDVQVPAPKSEQGPVILAQDADVRGAPGTKPVVSNPPKPSTGGVQEVDPTGKSAKEGLKNSAQKRQKMQGDGEPASKFRGGMQDVGTHKRPKQPGVQQNQGSVEQKQEAKSHEQVKQTQQKYPVSLSNKALSYLNKNVLKSGDIHDAVVLHRACQKYGLSLGIVVDKDSKESARVCPRLVSHGSQHMRILLTKDYKMALVPNSPGLEKVVGKVICMGDAIKAHEQENLRAKQARSKPSTHPEPSVNKMAQVSELKQEGVQERLRRIVIERTLKNYAKANNLRHRNDDLASNEPFYMEGHAKLQKSLVIDGKEEKVAMVDDGKNVVIVLNANYRQGQKVTLQNQAHIDVQIVRKARVEQALTRTKEEYVKQMKKQYREFETDKPQKLSGKIQYIQEIEGRKFAYVDSTRHKGEFFVAELKSRRELEYKVGQTKTFQNSRSLKRSKGRGMGR